MPGPPRCTRLASILSCTACHEFFQQPLKMTPFPTDVIRNSFPFISFELLKWPKVSSMLMVFTWLAMVLSEVSVRPQRRLEAPPAARRVRKTDALVA